MGVLGSMDLNDGIFLIAYAIEGENKESWSCFLSIFKHDLGTNEFE